MKINKSFLEIYFHFQFLSLQKDKLNTQLPLKVQKAVFSFSFVTTINQFGYRLVHLGQL